MTRRAPPVRRLDVDELEFMRAFMLAIGSHPQLRIHRQNCGQIAIRDRVGKVVRYFDAGPPTGAADLSGIVLAPREARGLRLEIELKSATGKRSPEQIHWGEFIQAAGGVYALVGYNPLLTLEQNVDAGIATVLDAIERAAAERRAA